MAKQQAAITKPPHGCYEAHQTRQGLIIICGGNTSPCHCPALLEAELSDHHDQTLAQATQKINRILKKVPPHPEGRKLEILATGTGLMLNWVHPPKTRVPKGAVKITDLEAMDRALNVKG